jgi:TolA-binding protein
VERPAAPAAAPAIAPRAAVAEPASEVAPARARAAAPVADRRSTPDVPEAPPSEALLREVRALDAAKASLERGDTAGALDSLDRHAKGFPSAALGPEADVLRVRSLLAAGDRAGAARIARGVIARDPRGPHARVVRGLLPELGSNP